MRQVDKDLDALFDDLVALLAANAGDKSDAAGIMLVRRVIKTLRRRQTVVCLPVRQRYLQGKKRRWSLALRLWPQPTVLANDQGRTTNDGFLDRAHHDLYISLVQRFRVKVQFRISIVMMEISAARRCLVPCLPLLGGTGLRCSCGASRNPLAYQSPALSLRSTERQGPGQPFTFFDDKHRKLAYGHPPLTVYIF